MDVDMGNTKNIKTAIPYGRGHGYQNKQWS